MKKLLTIAAVLAVTATIQVRAQGTPTLPWIGIFEQEREGAPADIQGAGWESVRWNGVPDSLAGVTVDLVPKLAWGNQGSITYLLYESDPVGTLPRIWSDTIYVEWGVDPTAPAPHAWATVRMLSDIEGIVIPLNQAPGYSSTAVILEERLGKMLLTSPSGVFVPFDVVVQSEPVPEPTTVIAGALLLLPFGVSTIRKAFKAYHA